MADPVERADRNIPDPVERRLNRDRMIEFASRSGDRDGSGVADIWAEAGGPGSYRWLWIRGMRLAPTLFASVALLISGGALAGWLLDSRWLRGEILGGPPFAVASAVALAMLAASLLLLRAGSSTVSRRIGQGIALAVLVGMTLLTVTELVGTPLVDWGSGSLRAPATAALIDVPLMALLLLVLDRGAPRYRWQVILTPVVGIAFLASLMTSGYQTVPGSDVSPDVNYPAALALALIYVGFLLVRPRRWPAAFLAAAGPGPSMARLLLPVAVLTPLTMLAVERISDGLDAADASFVHGLERILMLIALLWVITFASRRLQRFYEHGRRATTELAAQANVLGRMSEGVVMMRIEDSRIALNNPQFDAMHGYETGELVGQPIDVLAPEDLSEEEIQVRLDVLHELAETGETSYENRSAKKDGSVIWARVNGVVTSVPEHGPVLILVKSDVTGERKARQAGKDAELRFRQVFEQSPIGLCLISPEGGFERVNRSLERITGYSATELSGMTFAEITHPDDLDLDLAQAAALFAGRTDGYEMEKRYIRKNGEVVWVYLTVTMLRDPDGQPARGLSMIEDITERRRLSQQLQYLADHDPLTGLFNRRRLEEELNTAISSGYGRGLAILVIDLDNFKFVNDSYGHTIGDRLIVRTGELLKNRLRSQDTLARQGGDEFVIVLRDIEARDAADTADELVRLIARDVRVDGAEQAARVSASIGVAVASSEQPVAEQTLMMQADIAMYEAKDSGRNGARVFRPGEDSQVTLAIDWAGRLRSAMERDELLIYAQPIVELEAIGPPRFELFVRMSDRRGEIIRPGAFLPTAERHDLVQDLDIWVIRKAIDTLAEVPGDTSPRLSINLSGRTVGDPRLPDFVQGELERTGVDPSNLVFEITETSAIGNMICAQEFSQRMTELGCGFALDDFGTGFASYYYLKHIAFDLVKIDGEFVQNLASDPVNRLLIRALVEISRGMGKQTVAEQVEDAGALRMLREFGVDFVQGHYLGRPRPLERCDLTARPKPPLESVTGPLS